MWLIHSLYKSSSQSMVLSSVASTHAASPAKHVCSGAASTPAAQQQTCTDMASQPDVRQKHGVQDSAPLEEAPPAAAPPPAAAALVEVEEDDGFGVGTSSPGSSPLPLPLPLPLPALSPSSEVGVAA